MAIARNNFSGALTANEFEGVDISLLTVSAGADISAEIGDPNANSTVAGLEMIKQAIQNQGVNIIGTGTLQSNQNFTVMVRTDSLDTTSSTTTVAAIQAAIRALDAQRTGTLVPRATANLSGATVAVRQLYSTTA